MGIYLDYNATTPIHPEVLEAMVATYRENFGNAGSRTHVFGQKANQAVEDAREKIARLLGIDKREIIFTSGATESNNLALFGLAEWGAKVGKKHIISSSIEHNSVLEPLRVLSRRGFDVELVPASEDGRVDADDVIGRVRSDTLLVSVMHANNETGVIQPVREIGESLHGSDVYFHVDAAQTFGKLVDELRELKYDLLSISAHKVYGPQGIGALITRIRGFRRPPLEPITYGGGQEGGLRPGTLPVALIAGFGVAADLASKHHREWRDNCLAVKNHILSALAEVPHVINGTVEASLPNCLNVSFPGVDSEALMLVLRDKIAISNGSACTSAKYGPSHVLAAMGLPRQRIEQAVRISWGFSTGPVDLKPLIEAVRTLRR